MALKIFKMAAKIASIFNTLGKLEDSGAFFQIEESNLLLNTILIKILYVEHIVLSGTFCSPLFCQYSVFEMIPAPIIYKRIETLDNLSCHYPRLVLLCWQDIDQAQFIISSKKLDLQSL